MNNTNCYLKMSCSLRAFVLVIQDLCNFGIRHTLLYLWANSAVIKVFHWFQYSCPRISSWRKGSFWSKISSVTYKCKPNKITKATNYKNYKITKTYEAKQNLCSSDWYCKTMKIIYLLVLCSKPNAATRLPDGAH